MCACVRACVGIGMYVRACVCACMINDSPSVICSVVFLVT